MVPSKGKSIAITVFTSASMGVVSYITYKIAAPKSIRYRIPIEDLDIFLQDDPSIDNVDFFNLEDQNNYEQELNNLIEELQESLKHKKIINMEQLKNEIEARKIKSKELQEKLKDQKFMEEVHKRLNLSKWFQ